MPEAEGFHFGRIIENLVQVKRKLPILIANEAQRFFFSSFQTGGFMDATFTPWKEVQRRIPGTKAYKYPSKKGLSRREKAILTNTGELRKQVRNSVKEATFNRVFLEVNSPYGGYLNDGDSRGRYPARPFMRNSIFLDKRIDEIIGETVDKIFE